MKPRPHKPRPIPPDRAGDVLALIERTVRRFNADAFRRDPLPDNCSLAVTPPENGRGYRLHLLHGGREIIVSLRPGAQLFDREPSLITSALLRTVSRADVVAIRERPRRNDAPLTPKVRDVPWLAMTEAEAGELRGIYSQLVALHPKAPGPVITHHGLTLRAFDDCVALEIGDDPNRLIVAALSAPGWKPWHSGHWTAPPVKGLHAEYAGAPVFRQHGGAK